MKCELSLTAPKSDRRPSNFEVQCATHGSYRACNTHKALVGISPSGVPTFISGVPTFISGVPTFISGVPTFISGVPTFISGVPTFISGVPTFISGVPTFISGVPTFISELCEGSISDDAITNQSKLRDLMESGDAIMADRGWTCASWLGRKDVRLITPQVDHASVSPREETKLDIPELVESVSVVRVRFHVERCISGASNSGNSCV